MISSCAIIVYVISQLCFNDHHLQIFTLNNLTSFLNIVFLISISQYGYKQNHMDQIKLDHVSQVIGYHPSYLEQFLKTQNFIMKADGPLPYHTRHYLAILVS